MALSTLLARSLNPWSDEELLRAIAEAPDPPARGRALVRAARGAPRQFDERYFAPFRAALRDPDLDIRRIGIVVAMRVPWPAFRAELAHIAEHDEVERLRGFASEIIRLYDMVGVERA